MQLEAPAPRPVPRPFVPSGLTLGLALAVPLVAAKAAHWDFDYGVSAFVRDLGVSAHADVAWAAAFGALSTLLLALTARVPRVQRVLGLLLLVLGAVCALYAMAAVQIFAFLRSPLTYALLYLAGDMNSMRSSIGSFVTPSVVAAMTLVPLAYVMAVWFFPRPVPGARRWPRAALAVVGLALAAGWFAWGQAEVNGRWSDRPDLLIARSPHWEFVSSVVEELRGSTGPVIDDDYPQAYLDDFRPLPAARPAALHVAFQPARGTQVVRPRNVLVVVLESTGARYLSLYGSSYATTPNLQKEAAHALVFDSVYSHVGLTANSLAAMGLSIYPYMTWREYTQEYPDFPGVTLAQALKPQGYRTAFLSSSYLDYVGMDRFLENRGFDAVHDWKRLKGAGAEVTSWGGDERALVDHTLEWIDQDRQRPFFGMLWTQISHHPYEPAPDQELVDFFAGAKTPPEDAYDLGRYLNTLREVDRQLGRLFAGLRERGLERDTLVVVTGDHGESFGDPHPTWGHGSKVYDTGLRVPFMLWSPGLLAKGQRFDTVGGHVDLNPTVLDVLGFAPQPEWQGRSLLAPERPPRAYFYAANDDYLLGVREGSYKYIYNATRGKDELYDLRSDPAEQRNLASAHPAKCRELRQRVSAWRHFAAQHLEWARRQPTQPPEQRASLD